MNSVLEMNRSALVLGSRVARSFERPALRSAGTRMVMPSWLRRTVGTNDDRGMAALVGFRLGC